MEIHDEQDHIAVDIDRIKEAAAAAAGENDPRISISIVDNATIRELNRIHRQEDTSTDVLAFDYADTPVSGVSEADEASATEVMEDTFSEASDDVTGEVIVSAEKAVETAESFGHDPGDELLLYVVHGVLHLTGLDDMTQEDAALMRRREREVFERLGLPDPWPVEDAPASEGSGETVRVFTDGACRGNPGPGGWGIRVLYPDGRVLEKGGAVRGTTNNRMELTAAIRALETVRGAARAIVVTDSEYVRLGITRWLEGWRSRGWKTVKGDPVRNRDLWEALDTGIGPHVEWEYVAGHSGDPDNERCDRIAVAFAEGRPVDLADGTRVEEPLPRTGTPPGGTRPANRKNKKKSRGKALFYLSLVGGSVERHETWAECEARVKGVSNARFKKCTHIEEEAEILREWGVDPAQK